MTLPFVRACPELVEGLRADLGSTSLATTAAGAVHSRQGYYPYGEARYTAGELPTDHGFTGHKHEDALGLIFMQARYYDPALGCFLSADPQPPVPGGCPPARGTGGCRTRPTRSAAAQTRRGG
ncbi:MAG: RHS repeat-associated core domain-containing protein [Chloroflexota bacterium]